MLKARDRREMRLVRIDWKGSSKWGIVETGSVFSLDGDVYGDFTRGERLCALKEAKLLAPAEPTAIVCCGENYRTMLEKLQMEAPKEPVLFFKPPQALCNPGEDTYTFPMSHDTRYEAEICAVMKRRAWKVAEAEALDYVLGYTCGNDMTLYDLIELEGRTTRAKGYYRSAPLGPVLVTDLDPVSGVRIEGRVNGKTTERGNTRDQIFSMARIVSHISHFMPLTPGDVVFAGTPEGGCHVDAGDIVEVEIDGIGVLKNKVIMG
jgi:2-keto-4-pentenoate hydratase/2-oxohepta-3-ene-1,7-dioic acid hydratase in catechol pathway